MNSVSHTAGSSNFVDSLSKKRSYVSDQVKSNIKQVRFDKNPVLPSKTIVSSKPTFSDLDSHFDALEKLKRSGAIQVTYPKQSSGILVKKLPTSAVTVPKIENTLFSAVFSNFAQQFSDKNLQNVTDLPYKRSELVILY